MSPLDSFLRLTGELRCTGCGVAGTRACTRCVRREATGPGAAIPAVDRVLAPLAYAGAARAAILDLKLRGARHAAVPLVRAMRDEVQRVGLLGDVVTWVPGRRRESATRGFDHADILARRLAVAVGLPAVRLLERTRATRDQSGLLAAERWTNLKGAFSARRGASRVVLVDDLVTTGATASCCATELKTAGASTVEVVVPCRALV